MSKRRPFTDADALEFHTLGGKPGKIEIVATKPMATQRDLSLAYSPGVAAPVRAIAEDPQGLRLTRRRAIWSPSSRTARRSWAWAIWARWRRSR